MFLPKRKLSQFSKIFVSGSKLTFFNNVNFDKHLDSLAHPLLYFHILFARNYVVVNKSYLVMDVIMS